MTALQGMLKQLKKKQEDLTREIKGITAALAAFTAEYEKPAGTRQKKSTGRRRPAGGQRGTAASRPRRPTVRRARASTKAAAPKKRRSR